MGWVMLASSIRGVQVTVESLTAAAREAAAATAAVKIKDDGMSHVNAMIDQFLATSAIANILRMYLEKMEESLKNPGTVDRTDLEQLLDYIGRFGGEVGQRLAAMLRGRNAPSGAAKRAGPAAGGSAAAGSQYLQDLGVVGHPQGGGLTGSTRTGRT